MRVVAVDERVMRRRRVSVPWDAVTVAVPDIPVAGVNGAGVAPPRRRSGVRRAVLMIAVPLVDMRMSARMTPCVTIGGCGEADACPGMASIVTVSPSALAMIAWYWEYVACEAGLGM